jgi:hypothetical protein
MIIFSQIVKTLKRVYFIDTELAKLHLTGSMCNRLEIIFLFSGISQRK